MTRNAFVLPRLAPLALLAFVAGCSDDPNQPRIEDRLVVTVNSVENSISLVPVDGGSDVPVRTVGLGAQGTPVGVAARGDRAVVPLGTYPFAAVVDLRDGAVLHTVALPDGSGATGAAFLDDTLAVVANPDRNTVSPVRVNRGIAGAEIAVGTYPQTVVSDGSRVYVLNSNLVNWAPAGPGSVTVLNANLAPVATVELSGTNPAAAAIAGNRLYVLHSGSWGANEGSLSVVDLQTLTEAEHHTGFGDYPGSLAVSPSGLVHVGIYGAGIVVWDPATRSFRRGPGDALLPGGTGVVSGLGFDYAGRLHTADAGGCQTAGRLTRLAADGAVEREARVGVCPFGIDFANVPEAR